MSDWVHLLTTGQLIIHAARSMRLMRKEFRTLRQLK